MWWEIGLFSYELRGKSSCEFGFCGWLVKQIPCGDDRKKGKSKSKSKSKSKCKCKCKSKSRSFPFDFAQGQDDKSREWRSGCTLKKRVLAAAGREGFYAEWLEDGCGAVSAGGRERDGAGRGPGAYA
jgi:hypothetical protein